MARRQFHQMIAPTEKERLGVNNKCVDPLLSEVR
jgi:hypothetical protein